MAAYTFSIYREIPRPANHRNRHRDKSQFFLSRGFETRDHYKSAYEGRYRERIKVAPSKDSLSDILPLFQPNRTFNKQPQKTSLTPACALSSRHHPKCPPNASCCSSYFESCSSNCFLTLVKWSRHSSTTYDFRCVFDHDLNSNRSCCRRSKIVCDDCDGDLVSAYPPRIFMLD